MLWRKHILITISLIILVANPTLANWKEDAKAIDISGGEDHTLVLTQNRWPWTWNFRMILIDFVGESGIICKYKRSVP